MLDGKAAVIMPDSASFMHGELQVRFSLTRSDVVIAESKGESPPTEKGYRRNYDAAAVSFVDEVAAEAERFPFK